MTDPRPRAGLMFSVGVALASVACAAPATVPSSATAAGAASSGLACHLTGEPRVVRASVFGPGGLRVSAAPAGFEVSFPVDERQRVAVDPSTMAWHFAERETADDGDTLLMEEAALADAHRTRAPVVARSDESSLVAWSSRDDKGTNVVLGEVVYDAPRQSLGMHEGGAPHIDPKSFHIPEGGVAGSATAPSLAPLGNGRFLVLWIQGTDETRQLRGQVVDATGAPLGPALDVSSPDTFLVGRAAAAFTANGTGYIAFVAARPTTFDVIAIPASCPK
jgi:hypothetical protein